MRNMKTTAIVLLLFVGILSTAHAQYVRVQIGFPSGTHVHAHGPRPHAGAVWIGPEWQWRGGQYVVVPGYWARPNRHGAVWVPGHWKHNRRGYRWIPGHWR
jgi:hypothetical protein